MLKLKKKVFTLNICPMRHIKIASFVPVMNNR